MRYRLCSLFAVFVLAAALVPAGISATPNDTTRTAALDSTDTDRATLLRLLNADDVAKQERAVRLIGTYAHTGRHDESFFRSFVVPLHGIVAEGETEALRLMAVSALASIGTDPAIEGLRTQVGSLPPSRVRKATRHAIALHKTDRPASPSAATNR